jgi:hypothetical protein
MPTFRVIFKWLEKLNESQYGESKKYGLDAVYQISLKSEMMGWTIVFGLDDLVCNVSKGLSCYFFIGRLNNINIKYEVKVKYHLVKIRDYCNILVCERLSSAL